MEKSHIERAKVERAMKELRRYSLISTIILVSILVYLYYLMLDYEVFLTHELALLPHTIAIGVSISIFTFSHLLSKQLLEENYNKKKTEDKNNA